MRSALVLRVVLSLLLPASAVAAMPAEDAARFTKDLDVLASELPRRHVSLFHETSREAFDAAVSSLRGRIASLDAGVATVELSRIVALARDGHTALFLLPFPGAPAVPGIHHLPVQLYAFPDGLRVVAIAREHEALLGARLLKVGGVPAAEAVERVKAYVPRDNAMGEKEYTAFYLALPEVLAAAGLAPSAASADFTFETATGPATLSLTPMSVPPDAGWTGRLVTLPGPRAAWVGVGDDTTPPRWLARADEPWWFERLEDGTVYAQINLMRDTPKRRFAEFAEEVLAAVPKDGATRLVLDLRLNRGGNGDLVWSMIHGIIRHDAVNQPGRLFVLSSRRTFSAAKLFANALEKHTRALFVGEPTGSSPNHYGEGALIRLPETGLAVLTSTLFWQNDPRDRRPWIPPHVSVEPSYADLAAGRDPVLDAARRYTPPPAVADVMGGLVKDGKTKEAVAAMRTVASAHRNPYRRLFEKDLNDLGYGLLEEKRPQDAVAVLHLAADLYPDSANAWDSLGEAFRAAGVRHRAAWAYGRSLRLDPGNDHGARMLEEILEGQ